MSKIKYLIAILFLSTSVAHAEGGGSGIGLNVGLGFPFLTQAGVSYSFNDKLSVSVEYGLLDIEVDDASLELSMPSVMLNFHPFSGSWYIAAGVGEETLEATGTDSTTGFSIKGEVDATTTIAKTGWKWGRANGGFWFGIDFAYIMPSGGESTITTSGAVPGSSEELQDVQDALDDFGDTSYANVTFARFGWIF